MKKYLTHVLVRVQTFLVEARLATVVSTGIAFVSAVLVVIVNKFSPGSLLCAACILLSCALAYLTYIIVHKLRRNTLVPGKDNQNINLILVVKVVDNFDGTFTAWYPALPGCEACMDSPERAVRLLKYLSYDMIKNAYNTRSSGQWLNAIIDTNASNIVLTDIKNLPYKIEKLQ